MKKAELIAKLEGAKELTSVVSINLVLAALGMLEDESLRASTKLTPHAAEEMCDRIRRSLEYSVDELVDKDSAEFDLSYDNRIEVTRVDVDVDSIMEHVLNIFEDYTSDVEDTDSEL